MAKNSKFFPQIGQVVSSKAGRDQGRIYLIAEILSDNRVRVVDGYVRRLENPKLKNIKHLYFYPVVVEEIAEKLKSGQMVTNKGIRDAVLLYERDGGH